jgi:hypothetical protein
VIAAEARRQEHNIRTTAGDDAEDDPKNVDQAILATKDHVPQPVGLPMCLAMSSGQDRRTFGRGAYGAAESGRCPMVLVGDHASPSLCWRFADAPVRLRQEAGVRRTGDQGRRHRRLA